MPLVVKGYQKREYRIPPEGQYAFVCVDVVDMGMQPGYRDGDPEVHQCRLVLELDCTFTDDDGAVKRYLHNAWYTVSLHEKANLRHDLERWRGRSFDQDVIQQQGFDLETCIGRQGYCQIMHKPKQAGGMKAVATLMPPLQGQNFQPSGKYVRVKDRPREDNGGSTDFNYGANAQGSPAASQAPAASGGSPPPAAAGSGLQQPATASTSAPAADPHPDINFGAPDEPEPPQQQPMTEDEAW